jgi:hypothetical protein
LSDAAALVREYDAIAAQRGTWESTWQAVADHIMGRGDFTSTQVIGGRRRTQEIYDTTALQSVSLLAGGLNSLMTNPAAEWFHLRPQDPRLIEDEEVALWFEDAENQMYVTLNSPTARFHPQIHELYLELVGYATSGFFVEDVPGVGVLYSSRPLSELFVSENAQGVVDTIYRRFLFTARQALDAWGKLAPEAAQKDFDKGDTESKRPYQHMVRKATQQTALPIRPSGFPNESAFIDLEKKAVIQRGGYHEMPYMIPRWEKDSNEVYGRGPGITALADAKMLNEMKKTLLQSGQLKVAPPVMVDDDGVETTLDLRPRGRNVVRPGILNPPIQPINMGGDLGWGDWVVRDTRQQVQDAFHFELLQLIRDPRMTATQVIELSTNIQRLLAPVLGRFQTELLEPMLERTFAIKLRRGDFLPPPPLLAGQEIAIEYVSPVARAQREADSNAIIELFTVGANLAQSDPDVLNVMNAEEGMRFIAKQKGVPVSVLRSRKEVQERREADSRLAAQEAQQQQILQTAETAAKVLPALTMGSGG